jgi:hypothetical protein
MTGWIYDVTGSYDPGFNLAGMLISLSGIILFVIPYMKTKPYNYNLSTITVTADDHDKDLLRDLRRSGNKIDQRIETERKQLLDTKNENHERV